MAMASRVATRTILTPANVVTMLRIVLAPFVVLAIAYYAPAWWVLVFGFFAMITDQLDGFLARRYGTSDLGVFLDTTADKLMVLGSLVVLVVEGWVWWLPVAVIAGRELAMSVYRSWLARRGIAVPAKKLAKYKTWTQSFVVAFAITPGVVDNMSWLLSGMLWLATAITVITFVQYMQDARRHVVRA